LCATKSEINNVDIHLLHAKKKSAIKYFPASQSAHSSESYPRDVISNHTTLPNNTPATETQ